MEYIVGLLLGSGLVLAYQELDLFLSVRRDARLNRAQDEAIVLTEDEW